MLHRQAQAGEGYGALPGEPAKPRAGPAAALRRGRLTRQRVLRAGPEVPGQVAPLPAQPPGQRGRHHQAGLLQRKVRRGARQGHDPLHDGAAPAARVAGCGRGDSTRRARAARRRSFTRRASRTPSPARRATPSTRTGSSRWPAGRAPRRRTAWSTRCSRPTLRRCAARGRLAAWQCESGHMGVRAAAAAAPARSVCCPEPRRVPQRVRRCRASSSTTRLSCWRPPTRRGWTTQRRPSGTRRRVENRCA